MVLVHNETEHQGQITQQTNTSNKINFLEELSNFIFTSKYARYREDLHRRETWEESVDRVLDMHLAKYAYLDKKYLNQIVKAFDLVKQKKIVPSMRSMQFGGNAIFAHNARIFNCSAGHVTSIRSFAEFFYLLLCGTGVTGGFSKKAISLLPKLVDPKDKTGTVITYVVEDTIEGWADSVEALLMCYFKNTPYTGRKIVFDYSRIRKKGTPLKTGGGKAPGHAGLKQAHTKIKEVLDYIIETNSQTELYPINAYDILMHCADAVLSGGIRRAATMAIFDLDDEQMMKSKVNLKVTKHGGFDKNDAGKWEGWVTVDGKNGGFKGKKYEVTLTEYEYQTMVRENKEISWIHIEPQRARSNNSVLLLRDKATLEDFQNIIANTQMYGEPGFIFADDPWALYNPCAEIGFIPVTPDGRFGFHFCNLTSQNGAMINTLEDFLECTEAATLIGTLQAGYTYFPYLSQASKELTESEALLGVSITGLMDNPEVLLDPRNQYLAAQLAVKTNKEWAEILGIKQAARITCIKPEGTASLLLQSASGIHPHHARRYFRRVQCNKQDNVYKHFKKSNWHATEESVWSANKTDDIAVFPLEVSEKAILKEDLSAIKHLDIIKSTQQNWVQPGTTTVNERNVSHNVSCTVLVQPKEWEEVIPYLFDNRQFFSAVSLLPASGDKDYKQAPLERVTEADEERWADLIAQWNKVDYTTLIEKDDKTTLQQALACSGNACEIDFSKDG